jgi:predicted esterase
VALSGYLPIRNTISWDKIQKPHILQCHGDKDQVVHYEVGQGTAKILKEKGNLTNYIFKTYKNLQHSSSTAEMSDVADFISERLPSV